jgi:hypothetical protein
MRTIILCDLVMKKNNKFRIPQFFQKNLSEKLTTTHFMCPNDLILCTRMYLGMANNVDKGSFHFLC